MLKIDITRVDLCRFAFMGGVILFVAGCNQMITSNPSSETVPRETEAIPISPTEGDTQMTPSQPTPADPSLQRLIEKAKEDLAQRISISVNQINLVEFTEVEWSDSSLGCPQPGMDYLQVITPGYLILLEAKAQMYEYHSNRDTYFLLCENSDSPSLPKP